MDKRLQAFLEVVIRTIGGEQLTTVARDMKSINREVAAMNRMGQGMRSVSSAADQVARSYANIKKIQDQLPYDRLLQKMELTNASLKRQDQQLRASTQSWRKWQQQLHSARATALDMSYLMGNLARMSGVGLGLGIAGVGAFGRSVLTNRAQYQQAEAQILGLTGGNRSAYGQVRQFALKSPLTFRESLDAVNQLMNANVRFDTIMREKAGYLETMTKAAVFANRPLAQVVRAMSRLNAGGYLTAQMQAIDVTKRTFEQAGIGWDEKKNRPEGLNATTGPAMLDKIMQQLATKFESFKPEKLLGTQLSNIGEAVPLFMDAIGRRFDGLMENVLPRIQKFMLRVIDLVSNPAFDKAFQGMADTMLNAFERIAAGAEKLLAVIERDPEMIPKFLHNLAEGFKMLAGVFVGANIAQQVANVLQLVSTVKLAFGKGGAFGTAIFILASFVAGVVLTKGKLDELLPSLGANAKETSSAVTAFENLKTALSNLGEVVLPLISDAMGKLWDAFSNLTGVDSPIQLLTVIVQSAADAINALAGAIAALNGYSINSSGAAVKNQPTLSDYFKSGGTKTRTDNIFSWEGMINLGQTLGQQRRDQRATEKGGYAWPTNDPNARVGGYGSGHHGVDIHGKAGDPIKAPVGGKIVKLGKNGIGDYRLWIEGDDGYKWYLTHFNEAFADGVKLGATVTAGQVLGTMAKHQHRARGGVVSDPHVHIGVVKSGWDADHSKIDPMGLLKSNGLPAFAANQSATIGLRNPGELAGLYAQAAQEAALRQFMTEGGTPGAGYSRGKVLGMAKGGLYDALKGGKDALSSAFGWGDGQLPWLDEVKSAGAGLADAMRKAGQKVISTFSALELNARMGIMGIRQALMLQSGNERGAAAMGLEMQGQTIDQMFIQAQNANGEQKAQLVQALGQQIISFIGEVGGLKEKAPDIFNAYQGYQTGIASRFENMFGSLAALPTAADKQMTAADKQLAAANAQLAAAGKPQVKSGALWGMAGGAFRGGSLGGGITAPPMTTGGGGYWDSNPEGAVSQELFGCETGSCQTRYYHTDGTGRPDPSSFSGGFPDESTKDKAKQGVNSFTKGMQQFAGFVNGLAGIVGQWKSGDKLGAGGSFFDLLFPQLGGIGSAVTGLIGAFKGNKNPIIQKIIEPVKFDVESLSYMLGANPISAIYGGRARVGGGAFTVVNNVIVDGETVAKSVSRHLGQLNFAGGTP